MTAVDAITIKGMSFAADDRQGRRTEILSNVDLTVREREFVAIVGPSGSGKSTLLNFVSALLPVRTGEVKLFGEPVPTARRVGYMFQTHGLMPWRSILDNVAIGLEIAGAAREERYSRSRALLAELGLKGFEDHYPAELSGGMRQRAAMARTLVADPEVVLMDEPFGALDAQTRVFMQELFSRYWNDHRKTVLFVTHDIAEAVALADRVLVMSARPGRFIAEYPVDLERPRALDSLRTDPRFNEICELVWADIRREAGVSMQGRAA